MLIFSMFLGQKSGWQCNCLLLPVSSRCLREEPDYRIFNWPTLPSFIHLSHTGTLDPRNRMCDSQILPWSNPLTSQDLGHSIVNPSTTLFSLSHNDTLGLGHSIAWTTLPILSLCHHPLVTLLIHLTWAGLWITTCDTQPRLFCILPGNDTDGNARTRIYFFEPRPTQHTCQKRKSQKRIVYS